MTESMLALIAGLLAPQPAERAAAAERLARLEHAAQPAAVALVEAMGDPDDHVKNWVNAALEGLGPPSAEDLQPLVRLLTHESPDVAYWAATLLGRLASLEYTLQRRLARRTKIDPTVSLGLTP